MLTEKYSWLMTGSNLTGLFWLWTSCRDTHPTFIVEWLRSSVFIHSFVLKKSLPWTVVMVTQLVELLPCSWKFRVRILVRLLILGPCDSFSYHKNSFKVDGALERPWSKYWVTVYFEKLLIVVRAKIAIMNQSKTGRKPTLKLVNWKFFSSVERSIRRKYVFESPNWERNKNKCRTNKFHGSSSRWFVNNQRWK